MPSPFSELPQDEWLASNELAFAFFDAYPVNEGHTLVVPKREVPTWFEASAHEQRALMELVEEVKEILDDRYSPDGYNIGINAGEAAGQTVMHLHVHLIPRYRGDMDDPTGGVRHVIPEEGNYLEDEQQRDHPGTEGIEHGSVSQSISTVVDWSQYLTSGGPDDQFIDYLRPLFARASSIDIVAAFIQDAGLELLRDPVHSAMHRGAVVRILTGDYMNLTEPEALQRLLDWTEGVSAARASEESLEEVKGRTSEAVQSGGDLRVRIVEVRPDASFPKTFHPKSWRFEGPRFGIAFVGSSNLSRLALTEGIEWNLAARRESDSSAYDEVRDAFEDEWSQARRLTVEWLRDYEVRAERTAQTIPGAEAEAPTDRQQPEPHEIQQRALEKLDEARRAGRERALVVHATGLGKTWLAAFDVRAFSKYAHKRPRTLFVAHRTEILQQAADTFRNIIPRVSFGWHAGDKDDREGDVVFASIQKLRRRSNLRSFRQDAFDYLIIDEVHHAAADSYRRILDYFDPEFLLGLTATPDRADEADIRPLFDDFVAHRAGIGVGIEAEFLCPFHYHGLKDVTDYKPIPWRSGRFTTSELTEALATQERMKQIWEAMQKHQAERTIAFCSSIDHARFVKGWLDDRGLDTAAIYSQPDADDRDASLRALADGKLDLVCAVDILNEGVDIPRVDRVAMLRPTESPVLFMQQLGRGLRVAEGKEHLTVLDFVGNHRVFLDRIRTLLSLGERRTTLREFLLKDESPELPPGCKMDIELEAKELLRDMLPESSRSSIVREYRELCETRGRRPTVVEMYRLELNVARLRQSYGSWFEFLQNEDDLDEDELAALEIGKSWFHELETTRLNKSFKMVVVETLLEADALDVGMPVAQLADRSHEILVRNPELFHDITGTSAIENPRDPDPNEWRKYWDKWPLKVWAGDRDRTIENPWFERTEAAPDGQIPSGNFPFFRSNVPVPSDTPVREAFLEMTRELVEFQLARYRDRSSVEAVDTGVFRGTVVVDDRDPVLALPSRDRRDDIPSGELTAALPDGQKWRFRFGDETVEIARPTGDQRNRLPDLLRTWFGPIVGGDETDFEVEFRPAKQGWRVEPVGENIVSFPRPGNVIGFADVEAAAGAHRVDRDTEPRWSQLELAEPELADRADFAVQARGDSMAKPTEGKTIHDGDWILMRWARAEPLGAVEGRIALIEHRQNGTTAYYLKRVAQTEEGFELRSDNPDVAPIPASDETVVIALHLETLSPDQIRTQAESTFLKALREELRRHSSMDAYETAVFDRTREWLDQVRGADSFSDLLEQEEEVYRLREELSEHLETNYDLAPDLGRRVARRTLRTAL